MYALNKRFRPTTLNGIPFGTLAFGVLSVVLVVFAIGAVLQVKAPVLAVFLLMTACGSAGLALHAYKIKDRMRIRLSERRGKLDIKTKPMELA